MNRGEGHLFREDDFYEQKNQTDTDLLRQQEFQEAQGSLPDITWVLCSWRIGVRGAVA
jgi:hypothetical protein